MELISIGHILKNCIMIICYFGAVALIIFYSNRHALLRPDSKELKKIINHTLSYCGFMHYFEAHLTLELGIDLVAYLWRTFEGLSSMFICILAFLINLMYVVFSVLALCRFASFYPAALKLVQRILVATPIYIFFFHFIMFELCNYFSVRKESFGAYYDSVLFKNVINVTLVSIVLLLYSLFSDRIRLTWKAIDEEYSKSKDLAGTD